jgi:inner membrane protein
MPSPIGHAIAGITTGWLIAGAPTLLPNVAGTFPGKVPATFWREGALFAGLAALPDVDLLFGMHSGPTHSLAAAGIVGLAAYLIARPFAGLGPGRFALACAAAYASHVLLDWLARDTTAPIGIMALWPFSLAHYESDLHIFRAISRRYYQGWTFVDQNVRAMCLELVILMPVLALVMALRQRRAATAAVAITMLAMLASVTVASAGQRAQLPPSQRALQEVIDAYDRLLERYRKGAIEASVGELGKLLTADDGQRQIDLWIEKTMWAANRRADFEAALLLITDAVMSIWRTDDPFPAGALAPYMGAFQQLHRELKGMNSRTPFLKAWYLLWEAFRHVHANYPPPKDLDYIDVAVAAFPKDAQVLLAAGSRYELYWWLSLENAQRDLSREPFEVTKLLATARDLLRRSLEAEPGEAEARLRLAHVLLELNELSSIPQIVSSHDWTPEGPAFEYLARLFEGDLHERSGDHAAAIAAYDRAIALVDVPQSALVAKAHLAHLDGRRADASRIVAPVLSRNAPGLDPWWPYIRGQAWRFDAYLKAAHALVLR